MKTKRENKSSHICLFINVDWFVLSHFNNYLVGILNKGHRVTILTSDTGRLKEIRKLGVNAVNVNVHRGFSNLVAEIQSFFSILTTLRKIKPDVLELVTIKTVIYGGICSKILGVNRVVYYMSGLGSEFITKSLIGSIKKFILLSVYRYLMQCSNAKVIVENIDDYVKFKNDIRINIIKIYIIPGVGVDLDEFYYVEKIKCKPIRIAMVSRILHDKGVSEFLKAAKTLHSQSCDIQCLLVGSIDPTNSSSLTEAEINVLKKNDSIIIKGHISDIATFLRTVDIFVLPSYREGFPRAIMEAAASGIPVVTTDVIGCRSAVINNKTGIIVPARDHESLTKALSKLVKSDKLRRFFGQNARAHAEREFDVNLITHFHINVWNCDRNIFTAQISI